MAPVASAAALQRARTLNSSWRNSNQALILGGSMQLQPQSCKGEQASTTVAFPAKPWHQPLSTLLSSQPSGVFQQLPPEFVGAKVRSSSSRNAEHELVPGALRDRVACTRRLSKTLRHECLERLDQIVVPRKMCQRPSWTHLEDVSDGSPDIAESTVNTSDSGAAQARTSAVRSSEIVQPVESHGHAEVVVDVSNDVHRDSQVERMAALNFLRDFHATPVPILEPEAPEAQAAQLSTLGDSKRVRREPRCDLQEESRYLKLWTVEDHDLSTAASVWKSTAKGSLSPKATWIAGRAASSSPIAATVRTRGLAVAASATDLHKHTMDVARRAIEAARCETRKPVVDGDQNTAMFPSDSEAGPAARGVSSLLRTSLRYILQV